MRPSARKKIQREIKRSEAPCSESNNHRTTDAGAQSMSLAHYIEGGKLARERVGAENAKKRAMVATQLKIIRFGFCRQLGAGRAGVAMRARSRPSPRFLELSESKNDTRRVAEAVLASVGVAEEPGGQRIRRTEVGAQVIDLGGTNREV